MGFAQKIPIVKRLDSTMGKRYISLDNGMKLESEFGVHHPGWLALIEF